MMAEEVHYCQENLPSEAIYELLIKNVSRDVKLDREEIETLKSFRMTVDNQQWQNWLAFARGERKKRLVSMGIKSPKSTKLQSDSISAKASKIGSADMSLEEGPTSPLSLPTFHDTNKESYDVKLPSSSNISAKVNSQVSNQERNMDDRRKNSHEPNNDFIPPLPTSPMPDVATSKVDSASISPPIESQKVSTQNICELRKQLIECLRDPIPSSTQVPHSQAQTSPNPNDRGVVKTGESIAVPTYPSTKTKSPDSFSALLSDATSVSSGVYRNEPHFTASHSDNEISHNFDDNLFSALEKSKHHEAFPNLVQQVPPPSHRPRQRMETPLLTTTCGESESSKYKSSSQPKSLEQSYIKQLILKRNPTDVNYGIEEENGTVELMYDCSQNVEDGVMDSMDAMDNNSAMTAGTVSLSESFSSFPSLVRPHVEMPQARHTRKMPPSASLSLPSPQELPISQSQEPNLTMPPAIPLMTDPYEAYISQQDTRFATNDVEDRRTASEETRHNTLKNNSHQLVNEDASIQMVAKMLANRTLQLKSSNNPMIPLQNSNYPNSGKEQNIDGDDLKLGYYWNNNLAPNSNPVPSSNQLPVVESEVQHYHLHQQKRVLASNDERKFSSQHNNVTILNVQEKFPDANHGKPFSPMTECLPRRREERPPAPSITNSFSTLSSFQNNADSSMKENINIVLFSNSSAPMSTQNLLRDSVVENQKHSTDGVSLQKRQLSGRSRSAPRAHRHDVAEASPAVPPPYIMAPVLSQNQSMNRNSPSVPSSKATLPFSPWLSPMVKPLRSGSPISPKIDQRVLPHSRASEMNKTLSRPYHDWATVPTQIEVVSTVHQYRQIEEQKRSNEQKVDPNYNGTLESSKQVANSSDDPCTPFVTDNANSRSLRAGVEATTIGTMRLDAVYSAAKYLLNALEGQARPKGDSLFEGPKAILNEMVHTLEKSKANFREAETRMEPAPLNSPLAEVSKSSFHDGKPLEGWTELRKTDRFDGHDFEYDELAMHEIPRFREEENDERNFQTEEEAEYKYHDNRSHISDDYQEYLQASPNGFHAQTTPEMSVSELQRLLNNTNLNMNSAYYPGVGSSVPSPNPLSGSVRFNPVVNHDRHLEYTKKLHNNSSTSSTSSIAGFLQYNTSIAKHHQYYGNENIITRLCIAQGPLVKTFEEFPIRVDLENNAVDVVWREHRVTVYNRPTKSFTSSKMGNKHTVGTPLSAQQDTFDGIANRILRRERFLFDKLYYGNKSMEKLSQYIRYRIRQSILSYNSMTLLCTGCGEGLIGELEPPVTLAVGTGGGTGVASQLLHEVFNYLSATTTYGSRSSDVGPPNSFDLVSGTLSPSPANRTSSYVNHTSSSFAAIKTNISSRSSRVTMSAVLVSGRHIVDLLTNPNAAASSKDKRPMIRRTANSNTATLTNATLIELSSQMDYERIIGLLLGRRSGIAHSLRTLYTMIATGDDIPKLMSTRAGTIMRNSRIQSGALSSTSNITTPLDPHATWSNRSGTSAFKQEASQTKQDGVIYDSQISAIDDQVDQSLETSFSSCLLLSFNVTIGSTIAKKGAQLSFRVVCPSGENWHTPGLDFHMLQESIASLPHSPPAHVMNASPLTMLLANQPCEYISVVSVNRLTENMAGYQNVSDLDQIAEQALNALRISAITK